MVRMMEGREPVYSAKYLNWKAFSWAAIFFLPFLFFGIATLFYPGKSTGFAIVCVVFWIGSGMMVYSSLSAMELLVFPDKIIKRYRLIFNDREIDLHEAQIGIFFARSWKLCIFPKAGGFFEKRFKSVLFDFSFTEDKTGEGFRTACESQGVVFEKVFAGYRSK